MSTEDFRKKLSADIKEFATTDVDPDLWHWFIRAYLLCSEASLAIPAYQRLNSKLETVERDHGTQDNCFYYLATAPQFFSHHREAIRRCRR